MQRGIGEVKFHRVRVVPECRSGVGPSDDRLEIARMLLAFSNQEYQSGAVGNFEHLFENRLRNKIEQFGKCRILNANRLQNGARSVLGCVCYGKTVAGLDNVVNRWRKRLIERLKIIVDYFCCEEFEFHLGLRLKLLPIQRFGDTLIPGNHETAHLLDAESIGKACE